MRCFIDIKDYPRGSKYIIFYKLILNALVLLYFIDRTKKFGIKTKKIFYVSFSTRQALAMLEQQIHF